MKFLITGAFGYLGSYCAELLKLKGNEVTIMGRKLPIYMEKWAKDFNVIIGDITDEHLYFEVRKNEYDCVIHFAALNEVKCRQSNKEAILTNIFGTENILNTCVKAGIKRFIYISTVHVYGNSNLNGLINEKCDIKVSNIYDMTNYSGELLVDCYSRNNDIVGSTIRLSNFCTGPLFREIGKWSIVPNNFIKQAYENNKIIINSSGNQTRNFLSMKDLCNAINIIIDKQNLKYDVFNVGGDKNYSINEVANLVKNVGEKLIKGKIIEIIHRGSNYEANHKEIENTFDISKIKFIGYSPVVDIEDEIKKTFEQLLESGV